MLFLYNSIPSKHNIVCLYTVFLQDYSLIKSKCACCNYDNLSFVLFLRFNCCRTAWLVCIVYLIELKFNLFFVSLGDFKLFNSLFKLLKPVWYYYLVAFWLGASVLDFIKLNSGQLSLSCVNDIKFLNNFWLYCVNAVYFKLNTNCIWIVRNVLFYKTSDVKYSVGFMRTKQEFISKLMSNNLYFSFCFVNVECWL